MKTCIGLLVTFIAFAIPLHSLAWGAKGHHIVAGIALQHLSESTKQKVLAVLGTTSPEDAATWMDDMQATSRYDHMKPWHYIYIPRGQSYSPAQRDNIITALNSAVDDISQKRVDEATYKRSLMIIFHLVGDLHQPLHDGYAEDNGGSTVQLNYDGNSTNLHHIWSTDIIGSQKITLSSCLAFAKTLSDAELKSMEEGNFIAWMESSRALLPQVYAFSGRTIDEGYTRKSKQLIEAQLLKGGIRLAHLLETLFGNSADAAVALSPEQTSAHIGKTTTVCGKVFGGKSTKDPGVTSIYMGAAYPANPFAIIILAKDRARFTAAPELVYDGTTICVTGTISTYNGKPAITVRSEEQIEIQ